MIFQQILNEESGCLSYLIGCTEAGRALVVDPGRDRVPEYLRLAAKKGLTISHILETHTHADHISGNRDLAEAVRAPILVHRAAGVAFEHQDVSDGDELRIGNVRFKIAHTPGHTPDSICVMVSDLSRGEAPWFVLTGDMLFVGSVGRPDRGGARAAEDAWGSLQRVLLPLADSVGVYPAHGAGSACGKAMSAKSGSTIGFERRFNPALQLHDRQAFVDFLMKDLPPKPPSFEKIVGKNKGLISLAVAKPRPFTAREAWAAVQRGDIVLDLRDPGTHGEMHVAGAVDAWLEQGRDVAVIDVRELSEWIDGHIDGAIHLPMLEAAARRAEVPADRPKAVLCAGGLRSSTAISALKRHGLQGWYNVTGGMTAWKRFGYPVVRSSSDSGSSPRA